jgi:hydrogenase maturation protease
MTRVLVAGVGNVFFGDDGFGVEVARALAAAPPPHATVTDYGIRGVHLAYELLSPPELLVVIDVTARGGEPGTLYVIDPDVERPPHVDDAHGMHLPAVFASVKAMGGAMPPTRVIGCEPAEIVARMGLSASVAAAVPRAAELVRTTIAKHLEVT